MMIDVDGDRNATEVDRYCILDVTDLPMNFFRLSII